MKLQDLFEKQCEAIELKNLKGWTECFLWNNYHTISNFVREQLNG
ncbi:MAG: hypothetical protein ACREAU_00195 [Nitrosopumilaceae archaeon]